jgi:hypothetical protein
MIDVRETQYELHAIVVFPILIFLSSVPPWGLCQLSCGNNTNVIQYRVLKFCVVINL